MSSEVQLILTGNLQTLFGLLWKGSEMDFWGIDTLKGEPVLSQGYLAEPVQLAALSYGKMLNEQHIHLFQYLTV